MADIQDVVANSICKNRAAMVSEIARETDLTPQTVLDIARGLERDGKVEVRPKGICTLLVWVSR